MMNKIWMTVCVMFFGTIGCYASTFEEKFWVSAFEGLGVLLGPLVGLTIAGYIIRAFGWAGVCFAFAAYIIFLIICVGNGGFTGRLF
jgi:hypothetical protein